MRTRRTLSLRLVCLAALTLQGCGSGGADDAGSGEAAGNGASSSGAASQGDPCSLVSKEEVAAAIGEAIVRAQAEGESCSYETEDAMASSVKVEVKWNSGAAEMQAARDAAGMLDQLGGTMAEKTGAEGDAGAALASGGAVAGLGDQAFFGANEQLHVLKKGSYFAVSPPTMRSRMSGGNPMLAAEKKREMARAIAEKIAAKL